MRYFTTTVLFFLLLFSDPLLGQCTLSGQVSDRGGQPMSGTNIIVVGTGKGTISGTDGTFEIPDIPAGSFQIRASYLGFRTIDTLLQALPGRCRLDLQLEETAITAEELTVTATRVADKTPVTVQQLDRSDLKKQDVAQDFPYALRFTPSAVVNSDAGAGVGYTGIWIRGTDPTRINVTINGIPLNDAESQGVFWVNLPDFLSSAESVQIQRGVGASTNGAGAFGATIDIKTNELNPDPYLNLDGTLGAFNTRRATVRGGTGLLSNRWLLEGRLSTIRSDGYIDRASADLDAWYLSGAYVGDRTVLRANAFSGHEITYQAWYGVPEDSLATNRTFNSAGTERPGAPYDNEVDDYRQTHYQLLFNHQFSRSWNLNLAGHYTIGRGFFEQYKADQDYATYGLRQDTTADLIRRLWLDNDFFGGTYGLHYNSPDTRIDATLGGGYHLYLGDHFGEVVETEVAAELEQPLQYYFNDARKSDFNVFTKFQYQLRPNLRTYLDLQLRRVGYQFLGIGRDLAPLEQEVTHLFFNPKAGVWYDLDARTNLYLSFAVAQREPNRNDYVDNPVDEQPRPERLYDTEFGLQRTWERANFGLTAYYMYYRDQLVLTGQVNDVGAYIRTNVDRSYRLGLELQAGAELHPRLRVGGNATISRNRVQAYTEFIDVYDADFNYLGQEAIERRDTRLAFSPSFQASGEVTYALLNQPDHQLDLTVRPQYIGERSLDNSGDPDNVIDPYFLTDLQLNYRWRTGFLKALRLNLQVTNVFDQVYESNGYSYRYAFDGTRITDRWFYPQAGRYVLFGLGIDL